MEARCDLEVDVNGEEIFMVDKRILASFSGRIRKLFSKLNSKTRNLKMIFHDFPGGAEGFELLARFCYSSGKTEITPLNIVIVSCAAIFLEMGSGGSGKPNLIYQIEKGLEGVNEWTWSELLAALKQCQDLHPTIDTSFILDKVLDCLMERLALAGVASPPASLSDSSTFQFSCDLRSSVSTRYKSPQRTWWFGDLLFLNVDVIDRVVKMMVFMNFDHDMICSFLLYYRKSRFIGALPAEKCKIMTVVISLLPMLDKRSPSCKALFDISRVASSLKISKHYKSKLESLIGSQLDEATVDYLLVPSPLGKDYAYDVSLVLRLVKAFLFESSSCLSTGRLNKVASLIDSYLVEVSPDSCLKPSKFAALIRVLPDATRQSHDGLYRAIDLYLEVHAGLCEEEKMRICSTLNYKKLSADALKHLSLNSNFPSKIAVKSFINHQSKFKSLVPKTHQIVTFHDSMDEKDYMGQKANAKQILQCAKKHNLSTKSEKLEAHLRGMDLRMKELVTVCRIMETEVGNITRTRLSSTGKPRYLPKLCYSKEF